MHLRKSTNCPLKGASKKGRGITLPKQLPDPDLHLRESSDFILNSHLGRCALHGQSTPGFAVFLRDLVEIIHRLVQSCHLPEFTDHGLSHLCSLVGRISEWTCVSYGSQESRPLCDLLDPSTSEGEGAAVLLMAILFHDMGMLSQRPDDLDPKNMNDLPRGPADVPAWVRRTHVPRLNRLLNRLLVVSCHNTILEHQLFRSALRIAQAHNTWPWQRGFSSLSEKEQCLAAVLAVADLLDEDANRCDTRILLHHRQGTLENFGHWIRHSLTSDRILIQDGVIHVKMVRPPGTNGQLSSVFAAIRNQIRLSFLYCPSLGYLPADPIRIKFDPDNGFPEEESSELRGWNKIEGLQTPGALNYCLLSSFMPLALRDARRADAVELDHVKNLPMEDINLEDFYKIRGRNQVRSPYEQSINALFNVGSGER